MADNYKNEWSALLSLAKTIQEDIATVGLGLIAAEQKLAIIESEFLTHNTK